MTQLTPATITRAEEILLLVALVAALMWYLARRRREARAPSLPLDVAARTGRQMPNKYHPLLVVIHWFVAFALANLLIRGALIMRYIPNSDAAKVGGLRAHMLAGVLVLTLMMIRLVIRRAARRPAPATARNPQLDRLAGISHRLLYVLVIAQASSGLFMAVQTGLPEVLFLGRGSLPADFWAFPIRGVHYVLSRALIGLIALHLAGALYHTVVLRDGLLRRMSFGRREVAAAQVEPPAAVTDAR